MKNSEINYVGEYRLKKGARHQEPYWTSCVSVNGSVRSVVDAAGIDRKGENLVRLLPYGPTNSELDGVLQKGDLLSYMQPPLRIVWPSALTPENVVGVLKGRASHAELGYPSEDGKPRQISLWGDRDLVSPFDRPFYEHACDDAINIYRVSLSEYGIDARREAALKAEVIRWKQLVKPVYFPCGESMNLDPVDFTDIGELGRIASEVIRRAPGDRNPPFNFKLNCVQWTTLIFSLAVCYPLSRTVLSSNGWLNDYERNWSSLGFAEDGLVGLDELPIPFYTVAEAVENILDLYVPEHKDLIRSMVDMSAVGAFMSAKGVRLDQRVVMPAAFMIENRLREEGVPRKTKSVFSYVATAVPEVELVKEVSHA